MNSSTKHSVTLIEAQRPDLYDEARRLFLEYARSLSFNLCFQNFEDELARLPGGYAPPHGCLMLALNGSELAGCVAMRKLDHEICEMKRLFVRPQFQGLGIGRLLVESLVRLACKKGYRRMCLDTVPSMTSAIALYRNMGFVTIQPYCENPVDGATFMELNLLGRLSPVDQLETDRLLLRQWRDDDVELFARLNADPAVMEHYPATLTRQQTEAATERISETFRDRGFGLMVVELKQTGEFMGFVGLQVPSFDAHFMPCVEVGWRLEKRFWGQGYAPEAARKVMRDGYERVGLDEIVAMTTTTNTNSMRVMEKLGMVRDVREDFDNPKIPSGHHLQRHVLYRLPKHQWQDSDFVAR